MNMLGKSSFLRFSIAAVVLGSLAIGCGEMQAQTRAANRESRPSRKDAIWENRVEPSFFAYVNDRRMNVSANGSMTLSSGPSGLWLHPDGRFARTAVGLHKGFDEFCRTANSCGQYTIENGRYTWFYDSDSPSEATTESIAKSGDQLQVGDITYQAIAPVRDWRLNGSYQQVTSNIYASAPTTHFGQNGSLQVTATEPGTDRRTVRNGTYRITGYTLTYSFDNGETETHDFYVIAGRPYIDGSWYSRME